MVKLFRRLVNPDFLIRRVNLTVAHLMDEHAEKKKLPVQLDFFTDYEELRRREQQKKKSLEKERKMQKTVLALKKRFGKNAILKGVSFREGATARERNKQIGGHKA